MLAVSAELYYLSLELLVLSLMHFLIKHQYLLPNHQLMELVLELHLLPTTFSDTLKLYDRAGVGSTSE